MLSILNQSDLLMLTRRDEWYLLCFNTWPGGYLSELFNAETGLDHHRSIAYLRDFFWEEVTCVEASI